MMTSSTRQPGTAVWRVLFSLVTAVTAGGGIVFHDTAAAFAEMASPVGGASPAIFPILPAILPAALLLIWVVALLMNKKSLKTALEKSRAEIRQLRQGEESYRLLEENLNEAIFILDLATLHHTYVSPSVIRTHGYTSDELMVLPIDKLMPPRSLELALETIDRETQQDNLPGVDPNRYISLQAEHYHKNGSIIWVETTVKALRDESGRPTAIVGVARDITERKEAETALRKSEELYRLLAENISEVIYILDLDTRRYLYATPSVQQLYGATPEAFLGLRMDEMLTPESFDRAVKKIREELQRDGLPGVDPDRFNPLELEARRQDGSTLWIENIARFLRDEEGKPVSVLGVARDLTERKKAEASLKQAKEAAEAADRTKSDFLANMSHEIRTPMNGIIGMTELLLETTLSPEQMDYAESVKNSAETLLVIINDVLDFSKIEASMIHLEQIDFNLEKLCREVHGTILARARGKQITYNTVIGKEVPARLKGDPVRLRQILINLCDNAVKFTETGSVTVTIALKHRTDTTVTILFEVADTGIGIPPEYHLQIFESFSQVDASTTRRYGGTGLGLAISKKLVTILGGKIAVTSEPGRGSTFRFCLPFERQEQPRAVAPATEHCLPETDGRSNSLDILLVEDNPINLQVMAQMLRKLGHTVTVAVNGTEAVERFDRQVFDMVLMDIHMPVMDGITATQQIQARQQKDGNRTPVIAITANVMTGDRERILNQGLDDFIAKPVSMETLTEVISRHLT